MAKKHKCPPSGPNMSYMISFGDTMTALLAFFIVLNSLAEEQSGANLHSGTGSFLAAGVSSGTPGKFHSDKSDKIFQSAASSPKYLAGDPTGKTEPGKGTGSDDTDDGQRIIDRQKENYQRFLNEAGRLSELSSAPSIDGEISTDVLGKLPNEGPLMNDTISAVVKGVARSLRQPDREVELTVWCSHPLAVPWARAARQANQLRDETIQLLKLPSDQQAKLTAVARPWPWNSTKTNTDGLTDEQKSKVRKRTLRPAMSVTVRVTSFPDVP
jgi:flagellar motor protein MotB